MPINGKVLEIHTNMNIRFYVNIHSPSRFTSPCSGDPEEVPE